MHDRACPTCSGATDVPDGKGGIMPCPDCLTWRGFGEAYCVPAARSLLETIAATDPDRAADARARLNCLWDGLN